ALSPKGRVTYWNRFAEELFGWSSDDLAGELLSEWVVVDPGPEDLERLRASMRGETQHYERLLRRRDGHTFLAAITSSPIVSATGEITGAVGVVTDITPQRQLEEQLRQSQKMQAVGQLAGGVAHDFNNLLTVISGHVELLRGSDPSAPEWASDIDEIAHASDRAAALTRQLLAFSRKQMLKPRLIDINGVVRGLTPMLRRLIGEDVELVTRLPGEVHHIRADANQIEQVVVNLVVNARDAMSSGGVVMVSTRNERVDAGRARGMQHGEGDYVVLSVNDTGSGMDERTRSRVFEPFFTTKEPGRGTGLGLSTVYGIVEQSGGFVTVASELAKGSTFEVFLPAAEGSVSHSAVTSTPAVSADGHETILIAEDSDQVRRMAERILQHAGYTVFTARDGREALDMASRHAGRIDLVLTDVVMPLMSGRELAEALAEARPEITVVFMSGYTDDEIVRRGMLDPASRFIEKPFTAGKLVEKIRYHLSTSKAPR
ncbi:MAG TPA: response regulator, partial [Gemmatimonadaceae bacterium]